MKQLLQTEIIISLVTLFILGQNNNSCTCFVLTSKRRYIQSSAYKVLKTEKCMVDQQEQQHQQGIEEHQKDRNKSDDGDEGTPSTSLASSLNDGTNAPLSMPLAGGPSLIFAMARRMLIWDESDTLSSAASKDNSSIDNTKNKAKKQQERVNNRRNTRTLPRWHPHGGISDSNPSFRSTSPKMNSFGYSAAIRRNSRKHSPTLQRYALRIYFERFKDSGLPVSAIHYESALVAASKLGLWEEALNILNDIDNDVMNESYKLGSYSYNTNANNDICVNDAMIMAFIKSCVRGSKKDKLLTIKEKRKSLDIARNFLNTVEKKYNIQIQSKHLLPLAAAYKKLKLYNESEILIRTSLTKLDTLLEQKQSQQDVKYKNIKSKNKNSNTRIIKIIQQQSNNKEIDKLKTASYSLLVKQSIEKEDWENAILNLKDMVDDDVYFPTKVQI